jgi:hypothetical protein
MRRPFLFSLLCATMLGAAACTSIAVLPGNLEIYAHDYPLSGSDLREIQRLAWSAGIKQQLAHIQTYRADEASVICGDTHARDTHLVYFTARRRDGHWFIDKSSIQTKRVIEDPRTIVE